MKYDKDRPCILKGLAAQWERRFLACQMSF